MAAHLFFHTHRGLPLRHNCRTAYGNSVADSQQPAVRHAAVIVIYQGIGTIAEWSISGSIAAALQDLRLGWPGLLVQLLGGFALLKILARKAN